MRVTASGTRGGDMCNIPFLISLILWVKWTITPELRGSNREDVWGISGEMNRYRTVFWESEKIKELGKCRMIARQILESISYSLYGCKVDHSAKGLANTNCKTGKRDWRVYIQRDTYRVIQMYYSHKCRLFQARQPARTPVKHKPLELKAFLKEFI